MKVSQEINNHKTRRICISENIWQDMKTTTVLYTSTGSTGNKTESWGKKKCLEKAEQMTQIRVSVIKVISKQVTNCY